MTPATSIERAPIGGRDRINFADITAPVPPQEFLARFWTREAVLLRVEGRTFDRYFGWDAVNSVLNTSDLGPGTVKVARNDHAVPPGEYTTSLGGQTVVNPRAVLTLFDDGASFGITGAESYWPALRAVVDGIYDALLESPHANVYCSPPNTQGFHCHFDQHEVFVLQVEGTKHWRVFKPTIEAPAVSWRMEDAPAVLATAPYLDVVLQKGDVLYVPRGHWHYAVAQDSMSLHVTVGVTCRKGASFLDWLVDELRGEVEWRRNAPLINTSTKNGVFTAPEELAPWGSQLRRSLVAKISEPDIFERYCRHVVDVAQPRRTIDLPFQAAETIAPIDQLVFERPLGRRHIITQAGDTVTVSAGGSELQLEGVDPRLLATIFDAESFSAAEVGARHPEVPNADLGELLQALVRLGLLLVVRR
jgi:ribosomal protein L16 Arg81 hydroxylase